MPTLKDSRCSVSIPFGATGEDSETCGALASVVCENCGPMCQSCTESFQCPLVSDGKHVFVTPESTPTPTPTPKLSYTIFQTIEQMHDYLDRSGEVFEFGNTASPDSHGWRGQPVPLPVLRVVMDWPFSLSGGAQ